MAADGVIVSPVVRDEEMEALVGGIWNDIIKSINHVLDADSSFGFSKFEFHAKPSIEEIVHSIGIIESALNTFLGSGSLDVDCERVVLNCQQSVLLIRRLYVSIKRKDESEYQDVIRKLTTQPKF